MNADDVVIKARGMLSRPTFYVAGAGGHLGPDQPPDDPADLILRPDKRLAQMSAKEREPYDLIAAQTGLDLSRPLRGCDCSGFVCWVYGLDRRTSAPDGKEIFTGWIWHDARVTHQLFERIDDDEHPLRASRGALLVYPDTPHDDERYGHVAIVTEVDADAQPTSIVHCSAKNFKDSLALAGNVLLASAIAETDPAPFFAHLSSPRHKAIAARYRYLTA